MYKYLHAAGDPGACKIREILDTSFKPATKLFRLSFYLRPIGFRATEKFKNKENNQYKARFLAGRSITKKTVRSKGVKIDWEDVGREKAKILTLPTLKHYVHRNKHKEVLH